jgi:uncharacterized MAPEG superfamily protein
MAMFTASQKTVVAGFVGGTSVGWALFFGLRAILPEPGSVRDAVPWLALAPALVILVLVVGVASARFSGESIDPLAGKDQRFITVTNRVLANTLEQTLLFVLAGAALLALLPAGQLGAISALAALFAIARIVFWLGYLRAPLLRGPGMEVTLQINAVMLVWCVVAMLR